MTDERCGNCGNPLAASRTTCPYCRAWRTLGSLAREDDGGRSIDAGLARVLTEILLAKDEGAESLMLDRELEIAGPLAPSELGAALARMAEADPSLDELESLLARDANDIAMDGIQLASLVDHAGQDVRVLRRGLLLVRHQRFSEACEWWSLHRRALEPSQHRFELLLLMMEAFTQTVAGALEAAAQTRRRIREHPEYARLKAKARK